MAMKEGRCPNCGSLLMLDDRDPQGICMFCSARFASVRAIQLNEDPGDHEFLNEPQEELNDEERQLAFKNVRSVQMNAPSVTRKSQPAPKKKTAEPGKLTPAQKVALQQKTLIEPRVSKQHRAQMLAAVAGIVILLALVFLPLTLTRVARKNDLSDRIEDITVFDVTDRDNFDFSGFRNTVLLVVTDEEVSREDAETMMANFRNVRAEVYGVEDPAKQPDLSLRVAAPNGDFEMDKDGLIEGD